MRLITAIAASMVLGVAGTSMAGFVATTGTDPFAYTPVGADTAASPVVGSVISVTNQPLSTYTPDTPADPQITAGDVSSYLFSLALNVIATPGSGIVRTTGTYSLYYDLGPNGSPDIRVSEGTATLDLSPLGGGTYIATGALTQTLGPALPVFADLSYGNSDNIVLQGGLYIGAGLGGTTNLVLSQDAVVVPEPTTLGAVAATGLLLRRRRR